jgi:hypothetical protein
VFRGIAEENAKRGTRCEFVVCCQGHVGITSTTKNSKVVVGGLGAVEMKVWSGGGKCFCREPVYEIGSGVECLNPISRGKTCLK